ncbi:ChaC family protein [Chondrocystis sp. NIES-4102]|nr:ChaC family protein [Chondrocystis sp. NIES-4102]
MLNRQALESRLLQQLLAHPELNIKIWSDQELLASIRETLAQNSTGQLWIFGYGSLIWNPLFEYLEQRVVTIKGWHRQFCLLAPVGRGTIENPGLVLALEPGDRCEGVAYRLAVDANLEAELLLLWRREMVVGSYTPRWITATDGRENINVLAFTVNHQHSTYVKLSTVEIVNCLATATGVLGSSAEYLHHTVQGLLAAGIEDSSLFELDNLVKKRQQQL